jgi:ribulose-phosphate 3-epimerase
MDAHFASPLTIGAVVVASLRPHTDRVLHGHLMVEAPEALFEDLAEAGLDMVSVHAEAVADAAPVIRKARGAGMGVGITMNMETPVDTAFPYLDDLDDVMVTAVGREDAGRSLDRDVFARVEAVRAEIDRRGLSTDLEVEGGVTIDDAARCVDAGASVLVAGAAIFGAPDVVAAARRLKAIAEGGA